MKAIAHFYDHSTDVCLQVPNDKGGYTFHVFEKVSQMVNFAKEIGAEADIVTHHDC